MVTLTKTSSASLILLPVESAFGVKTVYPIQRIEHRTLPRCAGVFSERKSSEIIPALEHDPARIDAACQNVLPLIDIEHQNTLPGNIPHCRADNIGAALYMKYAFIQIKFQFRQSKLAAGALVYFTRHALTPRLSKEICSSKGAASVGVSAGFSSALAAGFSAFFFSAFFVVLLLLGHAQASTTLNLYGHVLPDHKKISMEKMRGNYMSCSSISGSSDDTSADVPQTQDPIISTIEDAQHNQEPAISIAAEDIQGLELSGDTNTAMPQIHDSTADTNANEEQAQAS